jgi:hypothetical protein
VSQLHYSTILKKVSAKTRQLDWRAAWATCGPRLGTESNSVVQVQPLRDEVTALQAQSDTLQKQKDHIVTQMAALEASIARCADSTGLLPPAVHISGRRLET